MFDEPLCPTFSCGAQGRCVDGACVCDDGYYGSLCVFDSCRGLTFLGAAYSHRIVSGASADYPPATGCGFPFILSEAEKAVGLRLRFNKFDLELDEGYASTTDRLVSRGSLAEVSSAQCKSSGVARARAMLKSPLRCRPP